MKRSKAKTKTRKTRARKPALMFPESGMPWTVANMRTAEKEGWNIFDTQGELRIHAVIENDHENAPSFPGDDEAFAHVLARALAGSGMHARAVAIHAKTALTFADGEREATAPGERWFREGRTVLDENRLTVADVACERDAHLIAAAPELRDALVMLQQHCENNVAYGIPDKVAKVVDSALSAAGGDTEE